MRIIPRNAGQVAIFHQLYPKSHSFPSYNYLKLYERRTKIKDLRAIRREVISEP
jgi:hypothetical protein